MSFQSWLIVCSSIIGVAVYIAFIVKQPERWRLSVGPMSYYLNVLLFYAVFLTRQLTVDQLNLWSSVIRLHSIFLLILIGANELIRKKNHDRVYGEPK